MKLFFALLTLNFICLSAQLHAETTVVHGSKTVTYTTQIPGEIVFLMQNESFLAAFGEAQLAAQKTGTRLGLGDLIVKLDKGSDVSTGTILVRGFPAGLPSPGSKVRDLGSIEIHYLYPADGELIRGVRFIPFK